MEIYPETDPRHYANNAQTRLEGLIEHLRDDLEKFEDPKAKALFETAAEVLIGLKTAFEHFEEKTEAAWR